MVSEFAKRLRWNAIDLIVSHFQERLQFGVQRELCELMRLPSLNGVRARALFTAGVTTISEVANGDPAILETALLAATPFQSRGQGIGESNHDAQMRRKCMDVWVTGRAGLSAKEAVEMLVKEARSHLEMELGVSVKWGYKDNPIDGVVGRSILKTPDRVRVKTDVGDCEKVDDASEKDLQLENGTDFKTESKPCEEMSAVAAGTSKSGEREVMSQENGGESKSETCEIKYSRLDGPTNMKSEAFHRENSAEVKTETNKLCEKMSSVSALTMLRVVRQEENSDLGVKDEVSCNLKTGNDLFHREEKHRRVERNGQATNVDSNLKYGKIEAILTSAHSGKIKENSLVKMSKNVQLQKESREDLDIVRTPKKLNLQKYDDQKRDLPRSVRKCASENDLKLPSHNIRKVEKTNHSVIKNSFGSFCIDTKDWKDISFKTLEFSNKKADVSMKTPKKEPQKSPKTSKSGTPKKPALVLSFIKGSPSTSRTVKRSLITDCPSTSDKNVKRRKIETKIEKDCFLIENEPDGAPINNVSNFNDVVLETFCDWETTKNENFSTKNKNDTYSKTALENKSVRSEYMEKLPQNIPKVNESYNDLVLDTFCDWETSKNENCLGKNSLETKIINEAKTANLNMVPETKKLEKAGNSNRHRFSTDLFECSPKPCSTPVSATRQSIILDSPDIFSQSLTFDTQLQHLCDTEDIFIADEKMSSPHKSDDLGYLSDGPVIVAEISAIDAMNTVGESFFTTGKRKASMEVVDNSDDSLGEDGGRGRKRARRAKNLFCRKRKGGNMKDTMEKSTLDASCSMVSSSRRPSDRKGLFFN